MKEIDNEIHTTVCYASFHQRNQVNCLFSPGFPLLLFFFLISASSVFFLLQIRTAKKGARISGSASFVSCRCQRRGAQRGCEHRAARAYTRNRSFIVWPDIWTYSMYSNKGLRQTKRLIWLAFWCGQVRSYLKKKDLVNLTRMDGCVWIRSHRPTRQGGSLGFDGLLWKRPISQITSHLVKCTASLSLRLRKLAGFYHTTGHPGFL